MTNLSNTRIACIGAAIGALIFLLAPAAGAAYFLMLVGAVLAVAILGK
jgi:hypothetical protein